MNYLLRSPQPVPPGELRVTVDTGGLKPFGATLVPVPEMLDAAARKQLRKDVEYLMAVNARGIVIAVEPLRLTESLENVTRYLLRELNARWGCGK